MGWAMLKKKTINHLPKRRRRSFLRRLVSHWNHALRNVDFFIKSKVKDQRLTDGKVACIMCTCKEEDMVSLAIESSKDFVSRYIVVDKDGSTVPAIECCREDWDLNIEIYVRPELNLRESRAFALTKVDEPWILIQDGDEVFHTDGPNSIFTLRRYMCRPHIYFTAPKNRLVGDFNHTSPAVPQQGPHRLLFHNNGTVRAPKPPADIPVMRGWRIALTKPYIFNCLVKTPRRTFLKKFWRKWNKETNGYIEYPNIERFVTEELQIDIDIILEMWYEKFMANLIPYEENRWGYYPKIIRRELNREAILGIHEMIELVHTNELIPSIQ